MADAQSAMDDFRRASETFVARAGELGLGDISGYYWYHTIELPHGLVTPGLYDFRHSLPCFRFPDDMRGMRVLDIGSATGFFAFEFERRGAQVTSLELPSLAALDRFPGQTLDDVVAKINGMLGGQVKQYTAVQLYDSLLEGPFRFCQKLLGARIERCYATIYELSPVKFGGRGFDFVFLGDVLLHTINPLQALAAVSSVCNGTLVLSQVMPDVAADKPAMLWVGGDDARKDELSWWWPNQSCLTQLLKKVGFGSVDCVGSHRGMLRPSGYEYERAILHTSK